MFIFDQKPFSNKILFVLKSNFLGNCQGDWKLLWEKPLAERDKVRIKNTKKI